MKIKKIQSKDISVIVQGAIDKEITPEALASIRRYLPNAEIILSTWEGANIEKLDYDVVILNEDPGANNVIRTGGDITPNNTNRQIISTQHGLKKAKRLYSLKLRSDLILKGNKFLDYFYKFPERNESYSLFKERIIVPTVYSKKKSHQTGFPAIFHPSDWWFFGLTEDLNIYIKDTKLAKEPEFSNCQEYLFPQKTLSLRSKMQFFPEQYICLEAFKRNFDDIVCHDWSDWNDTNVEQSEICLVNNFIFLDFIEHEIFCPKYSKAVLENNSFMSEFPGLYTFKIFCDDYKKYCDPKYKVSAKYRFNLFYACRLFNRTDLKRIIKFAGLDFIQTYNKNRNYKIEFDKIRLLEIELFSFCNRKCWFCPNHFIDRFSNNIYMDESLYLRILNDLKAIDYMGMISYSRYNEPLSDKEILITRLQQAKKILPHTKLHTNTNGDYLTRDYLERLYCAGLHSLSIQCYLKKEEKFMVDSIELKFMSMAKRLNLQYKEIVKKTDRYEIQFNYKDMNLRMYARDFRVNGNNRGGSLKVIETTERKRPCHIPFTDIYIDYNGKVMPCCNFRSDNLKHKKFIMGDINNDSILKIFNNSKFQKFRRIVGRPNIKMEPCKHCNFF